MIYESKGKPNLAERFTTWKYEALMHSYFIFKLKRLSRAIKTLNGIEMRKHFN